MRQCALPPKCGKGVPVPVRSYLNSGNFTSAGGIISPTEPATLVATMLLAVVALLAAAF